MDRLRQCLLLIGLLIVLVMPRVSAIHYQNTAILNPQEYWAFPVCGAATLALCSSTQIYYSVQAAQPVNVYWMDSSQFPVFRQNPSIFTGYDSTRSCLQAPSCLKPWFAGTDPDKTWVMYNSGSNSTVVSLRLQTRPVPSRSSSNQWPDWLIAEIVAAIVIAVIGILGLVVCGWYWRRANFPILELEGRYSAPVPKYNNLEGRGVYAVNL